MFLRETVEDRKMIIWIMSSGRYVSPYKVRGMAMNLIVDIAARL